MTHFKNKALLDFYNYPPKHQSYKNFKTTELSDNIVSKDKPFIIPEPVIKTNTSIKDIGANKYIFLKMKYITFLSN